LTSLFAYLPRGNTLDDRAWHKRHVFLQGLLGLHLLGLYVFGVLMGRGSKDTLVVLGVPAACLVLGRLIRHRRVASVLITAGLTYCSAVLVSFSNGSIEAHFHFFVMIGFIALYQDWVPFLWNVVFTVLSHGLGSAVRTDLIFNHPAGQTSPWVWSAIHGIAVLAACVGVVIFWETTEQEQRKTLTLTNQLADAEISRPRTRQPAGTLNTTMVSQAVRPRSTPNRNSVGKCSSRTHCRNTCRFCQDLSSRVLPRGRYASSLVNPSPSPGRFL
jgi:hypothetical protein